MPVVSSWKEIELEIVVDFTPPEEMEPPRSLPIEIDTQTREVAIVTPEAIDIEVRSRDAIEIHSDPGVDVEVRPGDDLVVR